MKNPGSWSDRQWLAWIVEQLACAHRDEDWQLIVDVHSVLQKVLGRGGTGDTALV